MGTTLKYALPYPDPDSSVDVPRDIKALADSVDALNFNRFPRFATCDSDLPFLGTSLLDTPLSVPAEANGVYAIDGAVGYASNVNVDGVIGTRFASGGLDIGFIGMGYQPVTRDGPASAQWLRHITPDKQGLFWMGGVGLTGQVGLTCRIGGTLYAGATGGPFVICLGQLYDSPTAPVYMLTGSYLSLTRIR